MPYTVNKYYNGYVIISQRNVLNDPIREYAISASTSSHFTYNIATEQYCIHVVYSVKMQHLASFSEYAYILIKYYAPFIFLVRTILFIQ